MHEALLSTLVHARTQEINARTTTQRNNIMNFIFFFFVIYSKLKQFCIAATYSNTSQNNWFLSKRKRFSELELISFLVLCNFPHVFRIFTAYRSIRWCRLSGKFQIDHDADTRTTTPVETTGFTTFYKRANSRSGIIFPDELIIPKIFTT